MRSRRSSRLHSTLTSSPGRLPCRTAFVTSSLVTSSASKRRPRSIPASLSVRSSNARASATAAASARNTFPASTQDRFPPRPVIMHRAHEHYSYDPDTTASRASPREAKLRVTAGGAACSDGHTTTRPASADTRGHTTRPDGTRVLMYERMSRAGGTGKRGHSRHRRPSCNNGTPDVLGLLTGSRWSGLTHRRFGHTWSIWRPAGIGPTSSS